MGYNPDWKLPRKTRYQDITPCRTSLADRRNFLKSITDSQTAYLSTSSKESNAFKVELDEFREYIRKARVATSIAVEDDTDQHGGNSTALIDECLRSGITVASLATALHVSSATIRRWQSGKQSPPSSIAKHLRDVVARLLNEAVREILPPRKVR